MRRWWGHVLEDGSRTRRPRCSYFSPIPLSLSPLNSIFLLNRLRVSCKRQAPLPFNILVEYFSPFSRLTTVDTFKFSRFSMETVLLSHPLSIM